MSTTCLLGSAAGVGGPAAVVRNETLTDRRVFSTTRKRFDSHFPKINHNLFQSRLTAGPMHMDGVGVCMSSRLVHHSIADSRSDPAEHDHPTGHHRRHVRNPKHPHHGARQSDSGGTGARTGSRGRAAGAFTLGHAGRQVRLGPVAFWTAVGTLVTMAGWSVVTATYFAFRDDVLTRLIARQAEMQYAYEDRIADLRATRQGQR